MKPNQTAAIALTLVIGSFLAGCGSKSSTTGPSTSVQDHTVWALAGMKGIVRTFDLSKDTVALDSMVLDTVPLTGISGEKVAQDQGVAWTGSSNGSVMKINSTPADSMSIDTILQLGPAAEGPVTWMSARNAKLWATTRTTGQTPRLHLVDPAINAVTATIPFGTATAVCYGLDATPTAAWVLTGDTLVLSKVDAATRVITATVALGRNPADTAGPRGRFPGKGALALWGTIGYVYDSDHGTLIMINLNNAAVTKSVQVPGFTGQMELIAASGAGVFITTRTMSIAPTALRFSSEQPET